MSWRIRPDCMHSRDYTLVAIHEEIRVRYYTNVVVVPMLVIIGLVGNILSISVMKTVNFGFPSTKFFIKWLAIFDIFYLCGSLFFQTARTVQFDTDWMGDVQIYPLIHPYIWPYMSTVQTIETWLVVAIAIDRYVALCHPLRANRFCSARRAACMLGVIIVSSVIVNIPHFLEFRPAKTIDPCTNQTKVVIESTPLFKNKVYQIIYWSVIMMIVRYLVPFLILCVVTTRLVIALQNVKRARLQRQVETTTMLTVPKSETKRPTNKEDRVTPTLLAIVMTFFLCETIEFVMHILTVVRWNNESYELSEDRVAQQIANTVGNLMLVVNATINFILYVVFAPQFRRALVAILCCQGGSVGSNGGPTKYCVTQDPNSVPSDYRSASIPLTLLRVKNMPPKTQSV